VNAATEPRRAQAPGGSVSGSGPATAGSPGEPIMAREPEFKILKNTEGEYYWHLEAADGRVVAWPGHAYAIKQACVNDLYWIKDNAAQVMIYDCTGE
jgi:uncharacterized protein YegP (UPF0339 family)